MSKFYAKNIAYTYSVNSAHRRYKILFIYLYATLRRP